MIVEVQLEASSKIFLLRASTFRGTAILCERVIAFFLVKSCEILSKFFHTIFNNRPHRRAH